MPRKCSVINCNTNYQNDRGSRTSVYSFPKDPVERESWRLALPKVLPIVTDNMGVCGKHWPPNAPMIKRRRLERPKYPPSIFWAANGNVSIGIGTSAATNDSPNSRSPRKPVFPVKSANLLASTESAVTRTSISYQSLEPMQTAQQQRKRLLPETSDVLQKRSKASALEAASAAAVQGGLAPMDLSRKKTPATTASASSATAAATAATDDVITLSDDEEQEIQLLVAKQAETVAGDVNSEAVVTLMKEQAAMLTRLRESLRSEECKLALLKAMRHSQQRSMSAPGTVHHHQQQLLQKENGAAAASSGTPASARPAASAVQGRSGGLASAQTPGSAGSQKSQHLHHQQSPSAAAIGRSQSAATLPMKSSTSAAGLAKPAAAAQPTPQISQSQLDAQKAQKKLALRKQLEKSLLEIPNPQPPPSELNFIPSTVTNEFIALVGLEEVVRNISEYDAVLKGGKPTEVKYVFHPFTCVQCGTDYTPVWKRDKPGSKNVICEDCVSTNQKNSIRKEHTARLKAAFVKALKQEEEIEKEFKRYAANPQLAAQAFPHLLPQPAPQPQQTQQQSHHQHHHQHHHPQQQQQHHHMPSLSAAHRSASSLQSLTGSSASLSRLSSAATTQHQQQQAAAAAAASQAAAAAAVEQLQRQHTQFLHAQLQAISHLYPTAGQASASSYPYTMPANYLTMLQQAMRQGMNFNPTSLWSTIGSQQPPQPGKK